MKFRVDSELEGASFRNTFGFNHTEMNLADAQVNADVSEMGTFMTFPNKFLVKLYSFSGHTSVCDEHGIAHIDKIGTESGSGI